MADFRGVWLLVGEPGEPWPYSDPPFLAALLAAFWACLAILLSVRVIFLAAFFRSAGEEGSSPMFWWLLLPPRRNIFLRNPMVLALLLAR